MASIVLIESNGTIKTLKTKELSNETLYKKCGFRVNENFLCRHTWQVNFGKAETQTISVWAKKNGKANSENKYDFPPPIDTDLFFGTCAVVRTVSKEDDTFLDLSKEDWLKIYEKLFGGFEDIGDEDEYSEDELANVDPALLTKNGYLKDGFVISDKEELTSGSVTPSIEDEEDDEDYVPEKKKDIQAVVKTPKKVSVKSKTAPVKTAPVKSAPVKTKTKSGPVKSAPVKSKSAPVKSSPAKQDDEDSDTNTEDTTSELEEEVYTFSDDE